MTIQQYTSYSNKSTVIVIFPQNYTKKQVPDAVPVGRFMSPRAGGKCIINSNRRSYRRWHHRCYCTFNQSGRMGNSCRYWCRCSGRSRITRFVGRGDQQVIINNKLQRSSALYTGDFCMINNMTLSMLFLNTSDVIIPIITSIAIYNELILYLIQIWVYTITAC